MKLDIVSYSNSHLEKITYENFKIMTELINNSMYMPRAKKSSVCCWSKKPVPQKLANPYNFKLNATELRTCIINFKKHLSTSLTSDEQMKTYFLEKFKEYIKEYLTNKNNYLFELNQINDKLKDEVDRYWEYFNIKKILSKQSHKIKLQTAKLNSLEDAQMQSDCIICMESERNVIFYPCRHFICCEICSFGKIGNDCPECHTKIDNKQITLT